MKICFITNVYSPEVRSGAERLVKSLSDYCQSLGHSVTIIERTGYYRSLVSKPLWQRFFHHATSFLNVVSYLRLKREIKEGQFDLVWTHNLTVFGLLSLKALGSGKKIQTIHDIQYLHPSGLLMKGEEKKLRTLIASVYQAIARALFPKDSLIIFPSAWLAGLYQEYGFFKSNRQVILKNPLAAAEIPAGSSSENFTFLYLGQIEEHKGVGLLLEAFARIDNSRARLVIAGAGRIEETLKTQNPDDRVRFAGPYSEPYSLLAKADCLVIPSICYENLPTVALEAARAEVPVLGSRLGGIKEAINDDELIFEPTVEALLEKLTWAAEHPEELRQRAARGREALEIPTLEEYLSKISHAGLIDLR